MKVTSPTVSPSNARCGTNKGKVSHSLCILLQDANGNPVYMVNDTSVWNNRGNGLYQNAGAQCQGALRPRVVSNDALAQDQGLDNSSRHSPALLCAGNNFFLPGGMTLASCTGSPMGCATAGPIRLLPDISNDPDYSRRARALSLC